MHRRHDSRRRRAALITFGLVAAASAGTLRTLSVAEARSTGGHPVVRTSARAADGKQVYATTCAACHQATALGVEGTYPPLAGSEWVTGDEAKLVRIVLNGLTGPVEVAGETYSGAMPPWGGVLKDADIAAVTTYLRSSFGNKAAPVTEATVASIRAATKARTAPWTAAELAALKTK
ncbi:MAG TPA: cytochrome c [Gemmatimonadaceae bacterium]|jgi:mono/diheme cytochrome c family protein|nr:cytochrome c [Gemmatimonadaceae bacterium]